MALPWVQEQQRRDPEAIEWMTNCETCMQTIPRDRRQALSCGYEPLLQLRREVWMHEGQRRDRGAPLPTCPGYTTQLPEVIETSRARLHWDKGNLDAFTGGEPASPALVRAIEVLEIEVGQVQDWAFKNASKGKG